MKQTYLLIVLLMSAFGIAKAQPVMRKPQIDPQKSEFALKLLGTALSQEDLSKNLVLSPYSAGVALSLLLDGADGQTQRALTETLQYATYAGTDLYTDSLNTVTTANSIWLRNGVALKQNYLDYVRGDDYKAQVETRDFSLRSTVGEINGWVSQQTRGLIPTIVDELDPSLAAILLNALYFKAPWADEFEVKATRPEIFHATTGDQEVPFMHKTSRDYKYLAAQGWQLASLPYKNGRYAMLVALPPKDLDVKSVAGFLNADLLNFILDNLSYNRVALSLPKFKVETTLTMNKLLTAMGAGQVFTNGADFSRMSAIPMAVDKILQKCFVEVSEEGTEAAAVTGAFMRLTSVAREDPPVVMNVDRPFFFAIYDVQTRLVLFEGRIATI